MDCIQRATTMLESRQIQTMVRCHFPQLLPPKQSIIQKQHTLAVAMHGTNSLRAPGCVIYTHIHKEAFAKLSIICSHLKYKYNETSYMLIYICTLSNLTVAHIKQNVSQPNGRSHWIVTHSVLCRDPMYTT